MARTGPRCPPPGCEQVFPPPAGPLRVPAVALSLPHLADAVGRLPPVSVDPGPYHDPPFKALPTTLVWRAVVNVAAGADADANAGGIELADAEQLQLGAAQAVPIVTPAAVGDAIQLAATFRISRQEQACFRTLRLYAHSWEALRALRVQVFRSGRLAVEERDLSVAAPPSSGSSGAVRPVRLIRFTTAAVAIGQVVSMPKLNLGGHAVVRGNFHLSGAGAVVAAGFPRIRQSADGVVFDRVDVIPQDVGQPDVQFPFDVTVRLPYVSVEFTNGGVAGTLNATGWAIPDGVAAVQVPVYVPADAGDELQLVVRNLDPRSAILLEAALDGWRWPVRTPDQNEYSGLLRGDPNLPGASVAPGCF